MLLSAWVKEDCAAPPCMATSYNADSISLVFNNADPAIVNIKPSGPIIDGWQRYEGEFTAPSSASSLDIKFMNKSANTIYFDDIRIQPYNANMKSYVYDPVNLRLVAELDANNYASFYEYDEEGTLIRTKVETAEGIKTINETRSSKQNAVNKIQ